MGRVPVAQVQCAGSEIQLRTPGDGTTGLARFFRFARREVFHVPISAALVATSVALFAANIALGGAIYEALLVDSVWPEKPSIIQPEQGGLDRKWFWFPTHLIFEVLLVVAIWQGWTMEPVRMFLLAAAGCQLVMRAWSFAYFIPRAVEFERHGIAPARMAGARTWVALSRWRILLQCGTLAATAGAAFNLIAAS